MLKVLKRTFDYPCVCGLASQMIGAWHSNAFNIIVGTYGYNTHVWLEELDEVGKVIGYVDPTFVQFSSTHHDDESFRLYDVLPDIYTKQHATLADDVFFACKAESRGDFKTYLSFIEESTDPVITKWRKQS